MRQEFPPICFWSPSRRSFVYGLPYITHTPNLFLNVLYAAVDALLDELNQ